MSRFLYACGLCIIAMALALYVARIENSVTAWYWALGFLTIAFFVWCADWILAKTEKPEYRED